jgi:tetratricopeptide (TPR) repeat protein
MEELNKIGMQFVQQQDPETGQKILEFCEQCTQPGTYGEFPLLRNLTYNNIGCLYRRVGKNKLALSFLKRALNILNQNQLMQHSAMTFLNLCAVVSQLGEYNLSLFLIEATPKEHSTQRTQ